MPLTRRHRNALILLLLMAGAAPRPTCAQNALSGRDPADTRLLLAPTARTLPKGEFSITLIGVLPLFQGGVTDRISMGAGIFGFAADQGRAPVLVMPKVQVFRGARTFVAAGALHLIGPKDASIGLGYAVLTRDAGRSAFTAGAGVLYARDSEVRGSAPAAILGVEHRFSGRAKVVADAYVFDNGALVSAAFRLVRTRFHADFGVLIMAASDSRGAVPALIVGWRF